jgi:opacity protein-like surface antigen
MKKLILLASALALAACAATQAPDAIDPVVGPGFWLGLWHGFIFPVAWIVSLFTDKVAVYAVPNSGGWYDFGYFLGIVVFGVGARKSKVIYKDRVIEARARRVE